MFCSSEWRICRLKSSRKTIACGNRKLLLPLTLLSLLQDSLKQREDHLAALEAEGQNLAKKQSKIVRNTKAEVREKENDLAKLKESKDQMVKANEELQELQRKRKSEASNTTKSLSATGMQAEGCHVI